MSYQVWSVVFGEQPSASKWNILGSNDASFNDGTGIADDKILTRHILQNNVTAAKLATNAIKLGKTDVTATVSHTTTETTVASVAVTVPAGGRDLLLVAICPQLQSTAGDRMMVKFKESTTILNRFYHGMTNPGAGEIFMHVVSAPSAGAHTYSITGQRDIGSGTCTWYADNTGSTLQLLAFLI